MTRTRNLGDISTVITSNIVSNTISISSNVGIGTSTPLYKLDVSGTIRASNIIANVTNSTVITNNGITARTLSAQFGERLSLKDFGAIGDGNANDTDAINAWLAKVASSKIPGYIPSGTYKFHSALTPVIANDITIYGDGFSSALLYAGTSTNPGNLITLGNTVIGSTEQISNLSLRRFNIGSNIQLDSGTAIFFTKASLINFDVVVNGPYGYGGNLYDGVWFDRSSLIDMHDSVFYTQNKGIIANNGVELHLNHAYIGGILTGTSVTNATNNGAGNVRLTVTSTVDLATGGLAVISGIVGTVEANGQQLLSVIDGTHVDLPNVAFGNAYISGGVVAQGTGIGIHIAGGYGGVYTENLTQIYNHIGALIDCSLSSDTNNQMFFSPYSTFDSNRNAGIYVNDSANGNYISKRLYIDSHVASTSTGHGLVIVNWNDGVLTSSVGIFANCYPGHGIVLNDPNVLVSIGDSVNIYGNKGYGIYAEYPINIDIKCNPIDNTLGNFSPNVSRAAVFSANISTTGNVLSSSTPYMVNTMAELKALTSRPPIVIMNGYYSAGDGGGGEFWWQSGSSATANDGTVVQCTSGVAGRYKRLYDPPNVYASWFGTVGNGLTNDYAALQAAVSVVDENNGGIVYLDQKVYLIDQTINARKGTIIKGFFSDLSSNTGGSGINPAYPTIYWIGSAGGTMFKVSPLYSGNIIWGGGTIGVQWNGGSTAGCAVHLDNTHDSYFIGKVRQVTGNGVVVSSESGSASAFSQNNTIDLDFIYGVSVDCRPANGLYLKGNGTNVPATQQYGKNIRGLIYDGALVKIQETDNAHFEVVHASVESGGTGNAVVLLNTGAQGANLNEFHYVVGPISEANGLYGNTYKLYNSESGGINTGNAVWQGSFIDYGTGQMFESHKFSFRDKLVLSAGDLVGGSGVTTGDFCLQWPCNILPDSITSRVGSTLVVPYNWSVGVIEGIEVVVGSNGTSGGNYRLTLTCSTGTGIGPAVTPDKSTTSTLAAGAQYTPTLYTFSYSGSELSYAAGDYIFVAITRDGSNVLDTNTDGMFVLGIRLLYRSSGPQTPGSGTYTTIPEWNP